MRHPKSRAALALMAALLLVPAGLLAASPAAELDGDWETVVASPRRPYIFVIRFAQAAGGWTGRTIIRGLPDLPLGDIRTNGAGVHFRFAPELDSLEFDGTFAGGRIEGGVVMDGQPTPVRLSRPQSLPAPANRIEAWRQDLEVAESKVGEYDRSFGPDARREFRDSLAALRRDLPRLDDAQVLVALSRAVALADNAHTRMRLAPTRQGTFTTLFPIRMWWFSDGPWVIRAAAPYRRALRCRVVAVDGNPIPEVRENVRRLFAGNAAWGDYLAPLYMTYPDVLHALGLVRSAREATFTLENARGKRFDLRVRAEALIRDAMAHESWQELSPMTTTGRPAWATALPPDARHVPLYLRHPAQPYWFALLPESGLLYFQYNMSHDADAGPSLARFGDSLLAFVRERPVRGIVVDLRLNSGGNLQVAREFMARLAETEQARQRGRMFVVTGRVTFSAGLYHAAQLRQLTQATFVGDSVGDRLDFWAEGGQVELPNSGAAINYSNGFHRYSGADYPEHPPYYEALSIPGLGPDVPAPLSSREYFAGRDPALEAIVARLRE